MKTSDGKGSRSDLLGFQLMSLSLEFCSPHSSENPKVECLPKQTIHRGMVLISLIPDQIKRIYWDGQIKKIRERLSNSL